MTDANAEGDRSRTFLLVGLGVVAVAALVAFVIIPLLSGDDGSDVEVDADGDVVVVDGDAVTPTPTPSEEFPLAEPDEAGDGDEAPDETFEVFNARDPFDQLVEADEDGTGDGTTPDGGGTPTIPPGTPSDPTAPPATPAPNPTTSPSPGTGPPPTGGDDDDDTNGDGVVDEDDGDTNGDGRVDGDDDGGSGDGDGNGGSAEVGGTTVTLVDVFTDDDGERKATVTVNGTAYTVGEGDTFARRFRLLDISGRCSTMLFGDSRFTLCEGERIRK